MEIETALRKKLDPIEFGPFKFHFPSVLTLTPAFAVGLMRNKFSLTGDTALDALFHVCPASTTSSLLLLRWLVFALTSLVSTGPAAMTPLKFFRQCLESPDALATSFLPSMPQDERSRMIGRSPSCWKFITPLILA